MWLAVIFLVTILAILAWKVRRIFSHWEDKGIPHQGFWEYMRVVYDVFTKPLHESVVDDYRKYGRLYGSYQDTDPCLVVGEPDLLREIYIKDFSSFVDRTQTFIGKAAWDRTLVILSGTEWKNTRAIITGAFTTSRLKMMVPKLVGVAKRTADVFMEHAVKEEIVNISDIIPKVALDSAAAVAFNADTDSVRDPNNPFMQNYFNIFVGDSALEALLYFKMPRLFKLLRMSLMKQEYLDKFCTFVTRIAEERLNSKTKANDQLQLLLDAMETETLNGEKEKPSNRKRLTMDDAVAQAIDLLIGGNDTIAQTLTFLFYALTLHPECQDGVMEEIDSVVGKEDVTYEMLQSLDYTEAVINETLRVYTPDAFIMRLCTKKTVLQGIELTPGNMIHIPLQAIHMDPEFFEEPESFKPERFLPDNKDAIRPFTFMPFGAGPRNCIGTRQAMLQLKIFLVCIYQRVKLQRCSETIEQIELKPGHFVRELRVPLKLCAVQR